MFDKYRYPQHERFVRVVRQMIENVGINPDTSRVVIPSANLLEYADQWEDDAFWLDYRSMWKLVRGFQEKSDAHFRHTQTTAEGYSVNGLDWRGEHYESGKMKLWRPPDCSSCGGPGKLLHSCPYKEELGGTEAAKEECTCCSHCERQCAADI